MKNIIIGEFKHETNRFCPIPADEKAYRSRTYMMGDELFTSKGIKTEIGGFLDVLDSQKDIHLIPTAAMNAMPSGPVTADMRRLFRDRLMEAVEKAPSVDGILLSLHGAMVATDSCDGEGDLLEEVRSKVGPDVPIITTLDLHANVTAKMIRNATAFFVYKEYPHTDIYDCAVRAARTMLKTVQGECRPVMGFCKMPLLMPMVPTASPILSRFYDSEAAYCRQAGVIDADIVHGFFPADIDEGGAAVIAVTDGDKEKAQHIAEALAVEIWNRREEIRLEITDLDAAIDALLSAAPEEKPFAFADMSDNPGGGGCGDTTHILRRLLERGVKNAAIAMIDDPESAAKAIAAGVGSTVTLELGGKSDPACSGGPIHVTGYVKCITDGFYVNKDRMFQGLTMRMGPSVVLQVQGIDVIVTSIRAQHFDLEVFRSCGITPEDRDLLVVKSKVHFRNSYGKVARHIFNIIVPGVSTPLPETCGFRSAMSHMYPRDKAAKFAPSSMSC